MTRPGRRNAVDGFDLAVGGSGGRDAPALSPPCPGRRRASRRRAGWKSLRERHSRSTDAVAQAHMRRIFAQRASRSDSFAKRFIPNPALLQLRLTQTGKSWRLGQYLMASAGLAVAMIAPAPLPGPADPAGDHRRPADRRRLAAHRRVEADRAADQAVQLQIPGRDRADGARPALGPADLRDDADRRRGNPRSGRHRIPHGLRQDEDRPDDGRGAAGHRGAARHAGIPVLRDQPRHPARDRRQPRRDPVEPRRRAAQARRR